MNDPTPARVPFDAAPPTRLLDAALRQNLTQLVYLRWIAAIGQLLTIGVVSATLHIHLPVDNMMMVLGCLVAFNGITMMRLTMDHPVSRRELLFALLVDVITLTAQLYLSGGISNPFVFLFLLQVIIGAVLLEPPAIWTVLGVTLACLLCLTGFAIPLDLPLQLERGLDSLYVRGLVICFALNAVLLVVFISRISRNLIERDARLAALRQRAAEEDLIVRMGLLASGAAHELGTPLATLSVILGDWQRMALFRAHSELVEDLNEMQVQLKRCKSIVSGILLSAGEARGESSASSTLVGFLDSLVEDWRATRSDVVLTYQRQIPQDRRVVADSAVGQMICNVLDNARDASPAGVDLQVQQQDDALILMVRDRGPGFPPALLSQIGKPYQSTKGRPGGGLGLFLVVNVARTLGGSVLAENRPGGGAQVTITLPLASIALAQAPRPDPMDLPDTVQE